MTDISAKDIGIKSALADSDSSAESKEVIGWLCDLEDSRKREKNFRKEGNRIVGIYEGDRPATTPFNILYSNTETMMPALYNSTPQPVVQRRFKDEDPLGAMASKAAERTLKYLIDDGNAEYTSFDDLMKSAVLEALLPGRGLSRFKYDAIIEAAQNEQAAEAVESPEEGGSGEATSMSAPQTLPPEELKYETVCGEEVPWDRFLHGNAKKWKDVPWAAFEHFMTREELEKNFGELGAVVPVTEMIRDEEQRTGQDIEENHASATGTAGVKVAQVFEVWDKDARVVLFVSPQWKQAVLKKVADPLKLTGFFPCPKPLTFMSKVSTLTPVSLYTMYEEQAKELNRITIRINKLIAALKVRGLYDSTVEGLEKVLKAEDNTLVPAENVAALLAQGNALEKAIWLMPIEKLVSVLQQLYVQREQVKTIIYELTGVADIMRGSSAASETLGAQKLKNQWGTLRLKKTQKEVMRYARDCLRIIAEIAVTKLAPETLKSMTGLPYPTGSEKAQAQQMAQAMQQQQMQQAAMAQANGQPPAPPQPPPPELVRVLGLPSWDDILGMLRDDTQRNYRIDIETNSTVDAEATEDKEDISELLNAISQFLNGVAPLVQDGTMPFEVAQGMLLAVVRRFRFGPELEDLLKKMKAPEQGKEDPAAIKKMQDEVAKAGEKLKQDQMVAQQKHMQDQLALTQQQSQLDLERREFEMEKKFALKEVAMEKQFADKELAMKSQQAVHTVEMKVAQEDQKLTAKATAQEQKHAAKASALAQKEQASTMAPKAEDIKPKLEAMQQEVKKLEDKMTEVMTAATKPKRAKKLPDGTWTTF